MPMHRIALGAALLLALSACQRETPPAAADVAPSRAAPNATDAAAPAVPSTDAFLVLPGAFAEATTVADLEATFGKSNVRIDEVRDEDGGVRRGVVLFAGDPLRRAHVGFHDPVALTGLAAIRVDDAGSLWRGKHGVHVGMSLAGLRKANGKPFHFSGFDEQGRAWVRDQWSPAIDDDDATLGALDVAEADHMYFGVDLGVGSDGPATPADAFPKDEHSISSDDPRYPRLGQLVRVTAITAYTSLDDEWE